MKLSRKDLRKILNEFIVGEKEIKIGDEGEISQELSKINDIIKKVSKDEKYYIRAFEGYDRINLRFYHKVGGEIINVSHVKNLAKLIDRVLVNDKIRTGKKSRVITYSSHPDDVHPDYTGPSEALYIPGDF